MIPFLSDNPWDKMPDKQLKDGRVCLAHSPEAQPGHGGRIGMGASGSWLSSLHPQLRSKGGRCCCSVPCLRCIQSRTLLQRMVPLIFRVSLPNSILPIQIILHRQAHTLSKWFGVSSTVLTITFSILLCIFGDVLFSCHWRFTWCEKLKLHGFEHMCGRCVHICDTGRKDSQPAICPFLGSLHLWVKGGDEQRHITQPSFSWWFPTNQTPYLPFISLISFDDSASWFGSTPVALGFNLCLCTKEFHNIPNGA